MNILDVELSTIKLGNDSTLRIPPRREEDQQHNYKELFDYQTLFSDIYFTHSGQIEFVGPPLLNLEQILLSGKVLLDGVDVTSRLKIESIYRKCRILLPADKQSESLEVHFENEIFLRKIQPNHSNFFQDCNVLVTLQKDNPIEWICYWVAHHVHNHKVNAVLLYDNGSSLYSLEELRRVLSNIKGLDKLCVISWDIPYGPTGGDKQIWDSDFGQHQVWQHAWKRFAEKANSVIIGDVDELIVSNDKMPIPEILSKIEEPVLVYKRRQIIETESTKYTDLPRMHNHTHLYESNKPLYAPKYAFDPKRISNETHLLVHKVEGEKMLYSENVLGRHFGALRIHWRMGDFTPIAMRDRLFWKTELVEDLDLLESYQDVDVSWLNSIEGM